VGNIESFDNLQQIWTNAEAQVIQKDIAQKLYTQCAVEHCGIQRGNIMQSGYYINVCMDDSCNLACASCRTHAIMHSQGPEYLARAQRVQHFLRLLQDFDQALTIVLIGNGDPLASTVMRPVVLNWRPKPHQRVVLFTNGLLMKKLLPQSSILPHISEFQISVDAGTAAVYEKVRRPGRFDVLTENLEWLVQNRPDPASVVLKFTMGAANAKDLVNFSQMCKTYGFRGQVTKLDDWNTFDDFASEAVLDHDDHPLHAVAVEQIRTVASHAHMWLSPTLKKLI
jgi:MoaA/NifB/PqqE/SkfB family radical SAM enzyme